MVLMLGSNLQPCRPWISTIQYLILSHIDFDNVQTFHIKRLLVIYIKTTHSISRYLPWRYTFAITTGYKNQIIHCSDILNLKLEEAASVVHHRRGLGGKYKCMNGRRESCPLSFTHDAFYTCVDTSTQQYSSKTYFDTVQNIFWICQYDSEKVPAKG